MNFRILVALGMVASMTAGEVLAQACPTGTTRVSALTALIGNNTLCATRGADRWQEYHQGNTSGPLIDWKQGSPHPVDPTATVGTFTLSNGSSSTLTHTYGGVSYTWLVCRVDVMPTVYTLIASGAGGTITGATVRTNQVACLP